jgi:MFS family permease
VRYKVMVFLCVLSFLSYFDRVCISRASESIEHDLLFDDRMMGLIMGAFWLAYGLFEIPGGWMGDRWGARLTLTRIVLAWSVFTALSGSAVGFLSLLVCRLLFGVGEAGAFPNMARVQSEWLPVKSRARAGGLLWLSARWGGAFSPLIFGGLLTFCRAPAFRHALSGLGLGSLSEAADWRFGFWASGLMGIAWCLALYPWFRDDPAEKRGVNQAELALINQDRGPDPSHSHDARVWKLLLTNRNLWAMAILYFFNGFGWIFLASWVPTFFKTRFQVSFEDSELISGLPLFLGGLSCLVGGLLSDWLVKRTGRRRLCRALFPVAGYAMASAAMLGLSVADTKTTAIVLLCVAGAAIDFGQGANWASIVDIGGQYAGTATGFINMIGNTGNTLGPIIAAQIFSFGLTGWRVLFCVYACTFLIAASMWLFIDPNQTFYDERLHAEEAQVIEELL